MIIAATILIIIFKKDINKFTEKHKNCNTMISTKALQTSDKSKKSKYSAKHSKKKNWTDNEEEKREISKIKEKLNQYLSNDERSDLISDLFGSTNPMILEIVYKELDNPDVDIRLEALDLLSEFQSEDVFDNLAKALNDKSPEVRVAAIEILDDIEIKGGSNTEVDLIARGVADESEDVRDAALSVLEDKPRGELESIAETAITSKYPEVKEEILSNLAMRPSLKGVDIMIRGLRDKNSDFKESVQFELEVITDQDFSSYEEAKRWWDKNKSKFEKEFAEDEENDYDE